MKYKAPVMKSTFLLKGLFADVFEPLGTLDLIQPILEEAGRFSQEVLSPLNKVGDQQGSKLVNGKVKTPDGFIEGFSAYAVAGWPGLDLPEQYGGQDLPLPLQVAFAEMVNGANVSFGMLAIQSRAAAWLLLEHANDELRELVVPRLVSGDWTATISITEPEAGSDVGRIACKAEPQSDGSYLLSGTKIFISFADHDMSEQIVHMVLARTPGAPTGTRGISLFLVPKNDFSNGSANQLSVSRVENKMGLKASPTCVLEFDQAKAYRVGPESRGLPCMFAMVKLMRLEVAIQGVGLAEAANQAAWRYARERHQGGSPDKKPLAIIEHADVKRLLLDSECRILAMRALVFETSALLHAERSCRDTKVVEDSAALANFLLPICKACASDLASLASNNALQVHGGHGYIVEAGVEQYVRDSRVMSIYEGTNGIQAIDLLTRKLLKDNGSAYHLFLDRIKADLLSLSSCVNAQVLEAVTAAVELLETQTNSLLKSALQPAPGMMVVATDYLRLVGVVAGAWMWLRMCVQSNDDKVADSATDNIDYKKMAAFYCCYVLPEATMHAQRIERCADLTESLD